MAKIKRIFTISESAFATVIEKEGKLESFVICSDYEFNEVKTHEAEILITIRGAEAEKENDIKKLITVNPPESHSVSIEYEKVEENKLKIIFE